MLKVEFEGKTYMIEGQAQFTNRLFNGDNFMDVAEGERYNFEMSEKAIDEDGNEYVVYYVMEDIKGREWDSDNFDWEIDRVEEV